MSTQVFAIYYGKSRKPSLITARDIDEAIEFTRFCHTRLMPHVPAEAVKLNRFRGDPARHVGLDRHTIRWMMRTFKKGK